MKCAIVKRAVNSRGWWCSSQLGKCKKEENCTKKKRKSFQFIFLVSLCKMRKQLFLLPSIVKAIMGLCEWNKYNDHLTYGIWNMFNILFSHSNNIHPFSPYSLTHSFNNDIIVMYIWRGQQQHHGEEHVNEGEKIFYTHVLTK